MGDKSARGQNAPAHINSPACTTELTYVSVADHINSPAYTTELTEVHKSAHLTSGNLMSELSFPALQLSKSSSCLLLQVLKRPVVQK